VKWKHQLTLTESNEEKYYLVTKQGKDEETKKQKNKIKYAVICGKEQRWQQAKENNFTAVDDKKEK
jgi:hypothetical protein